MIAPDQRNATRPRGRCFVHPHSLTNLSDATLIRDLKDLIARDRATTAALLAHIAEVDARRLFAPAGYPSMFAYCVGELRLSEGATYKRITAARAARKYPILFEHVAAGRLHLTAIKFLAPHLSPANAEELLESAIGLGKVELEDMLARRFPDPLAEAPLLAPDTTAHATQPVLAQLIPTGLENVSQLVPEPVETAGTRASVETTPPFVPAPGSANHLTVARPRFLLQVSIEPKTRHKLHYLQTLLSHSIPSSDVAQVIDRALDALIAQVEKQKFAATTRPQARARAARVAATRAVPASVRRAVWARDQGRCTFLGETLQRCRSRSFLEFDHIEPVARGGLATIENLRLRCRTHNQYEAERAFGAGFMVRKRAERRVQSQEAPVQTPAAVGTARPSTEARPAGTPRRATTSHRE